jgi:hypothetical protein
MRPHCGEGALRAMDRWVRRGTGATRFNEKPYGETIKSVTGVRSAGDRFQQPFFCADLFPSYQRPLSLLERFLELVVAHAGVAKLQEDLTRKFFTQAAVLYMLLITAAVMKRAHAGRDLSRPERFAVYITAPLAPVAEEIAASAIDPANRSVIFILHIPPPVLWFMPAYTAGQTSIHEI